MSTKWDKKRGRESHTKIHQIWGECQSAKYGRGPKKAILSREGGGSCCCNCLGGWRCCCAREGGGGMLFHYLCRAQLSLQWNQLYRIATSRLAMLLAGGTASQDNVQTSPTCITKLMPRKLTPKKLKMK
ncbi:hypothetical protein BS78_05G188900 [Paspalum vaginatum]|nr:hypothetical protein BS78_05G188900 [Paspalum vaginatum]